MQKTNLAAVAVGMGALNQRIWYFRIYIFSESYGLTNSCSMPVGPRAPVSLADVASTEKYLKKHPLEVMIFVGSSEINWNRNGRYWPFSCAQYKSLHQLLDFPNAIWGVDVSAHDTSII